MECECGLSPIYPASRRSGTGQFFRASSACFFASPHFRSAVETHSISSGLPDPLFFVILSHAIFLHLVPFSCLSQSWFAASRARRTRRCCISTVVHFLPGFCCSATFPQPLHPRLTNHDRPFRPTHQPPGKRRQRAGGRAPHSRKGSPSTTESAPRFFSLSLLPSPGTSLSSAVFNSTRHTEYTQRLRHHVRPGIHPSRVPRGALGC